MAGMHLISDATFEDKSSWLPMKLNPRPCALKQMF